jgi:hypothetical protein
MKRIFFASIALTTLFFACKKHDGFVINGKITNASGKYIYLEELRVSSSIPVDSFKIGKDGTFKFEGKIGYPNFYLLSLDKNNFVTLLVDTTEQISVRADAANFSHDYVVDGSSGSKLVQQLNNTLTRTKHQIDSMPCRKSEATSKLKTSNKHKFAILPNLYRSIRFQWLRFWHSTRNSTIRITLFRTCIR